MLIKSLSNEKTMFLNMYKEVAKKNVDYLDLMKSLGAISENKYTKLKKFNKKCITNICSNISRSNGF